jgi:CTP:molybdopterin cytidylyltransferase MocA
MRASCSACDQVENACAQDAFHDVDVSDLDAATARRVREAAPVDRAALVQAVFRGRPGHPALLGRDHWEPLAGEVRGDVGARAYLASHGALPVETADLSTGEDVDRRA